MRIGESDVRHVAKLAELAVAEADLALLAAQLDGIVGFVGQLESVPLNDADSGVVVGPARARLRDDVIDPLPMTRTPAEIAPVFQQGFFVVPKLGGMAEE